MVTGSIKENKAAGVKSSAVVGAEQRLGDLISTFPFLFVHPISMLQRYYHNLAVKE